MRIVSIFSFLAIAAVVCIGIAIASSDDLVVEGSGKMAKETRGLRDFHAVSVGGAMTVELHAGADYHVEIEGDDNLIKYVETKVEEGTLDISMKDGYGFSNGTIRAVITLPVLDKLEVSGATTLSARDIKVPELALEVAGASHVTIFGEAERVECELSGASTLTASSLKASSVNIDCSGASRARVYAEKQIMIDASGASHVTYAGNPAKVENETSGASSVSRE